MTVSDVRSCTFIIAFCNVSGKLLFFILCRNEFFLLLKSDVSVFMCLIFMFFVVGQVMCFRVCVCM